MNPYFLPDRIESQLIKLIQDAHHYDYCLIRTTSTMLNKSIIDASGEFRNLVYENNFIDYSTLTQGKIYRANILIFIENTVRENIISYYRPKTKLGDPRFWIYKLSSFVDENTLLYFTFWKENLLCIPLTTSFSLENLILELGIKTSKEEKLLKDLLGKLRGISKKGWIESVSPHMDAPRSIGDTLESELNIPVNNLISADYYGAVEIKAKNSITKTSDTLFSKVPNWESSPIKSSKDIIFRYGYIDSLNSSLIRLYITVGNTPNIQGLYLEVDYENRYILQKHIEDGVVCRWGFDTVKKRLFEKHPKTAWIIGEKKRFYDKIHFRYTKVEITKDPLFSQFLELIEEGKLTFDWRGKMKTDGSEYRDHGHAFRLTNPSLRSRLFGKTSVEYL